MIPYSPMLAAPMPKKSVDLQGGDWYAEEKYDGHRVIVEHSYGGVFVWSRDGLLRELPPHLIEAVKKLPRAVYDAEQYVPGKRSYGVTEIVNGPDNVLSIFDVLATEGIGEGGPDSPLILSTPYHVRREILIGMVPSAGPVHHSWAEQIHDQEQLVNLLTHVWTQGKEGLILKHKDSLYYPGKRPKNAWIKMKQLQSAVLTVVGFMPSKGLINNRGNYATIVLKDDEDNYTVVKTRNDAECRKLEEFQRGRPLAWREIRLPDRTKLKFHVGVAGSEFELGNPPLEVHPAIGKQLRIEFQERTSNQFIREHPEFSLSSYRHPRMDRWEDE